MKIVIQCSATKNRKAGSFSWNGRRVKFVAHPVKFSDELCGDVQFSPDELKPATSITWRDHLLEYNRKGDNFDHLLPSVDLYAHEIYQRLLYHVGRENFYILSAGWGLIKSNFLIPDYDITFSSQAGPWKRRTKRDLFKDFAQLTQAELSDNEQIYFFCCKDYLDLCYKLTDSLITRKVIYFVSPNIRKEQGYEYIQYSKSFTNWHYSCASDFIKGIISK